MLPDFKMYHKTIVTSKNVAYHRDKKKKKDQWSIIESRNRPIPIQTADFDK